ncbi:MAG: sirohydrochlorin cobaltochelatase [Lachnospiraceae bacterium]|nr:sirohydrochlorin cobaltochelatase [Lachnospiraceae bacterium]
MTDRKKAILVVSFGTSINEAREKTIDKIEDDFRREFPDHSIYRAWTSKMIIRKILKRDGIRIMTVTDAVEQMIADGIQELVVQPTHILNGIENDIMISEVNSFAESFESIRFGNPLLSSTNDNLAVIAAIKNEYPEIPDNEALVFMGHGTVHFTNTVYAALDFTLKDYWHSNIFMGTVEAYPSLSTMVKLVKALNPTRVHLAPFMIVAGDHAINDMAGEEEDSWKNVFLHEGYDVVCHLKGIGEYPAIRRIFIDHAREAMQA